VSDQKKTILTLEATDDDKYQYHVGSQQKIDKALIKSRNIHIFFCTEIKNFYRRIYV